MKNRLLLTAIILFFVFDLGLFMYYLYAKNATPSAPSAKKISVNEFLPTINLSDIKIEKEKASKRAIFQGSFQIDNQESASVSDISFISEVFKINLEKKGDIELIDRKTLTDIVNLKPQEKKVIPFAHDLPPNINTGAHIITIKAVNQTGVALGSTSTFVKSVQGTNKFLEINWRDSRLIHDGQEKGILEGPTFQPKDRPQITLIVKNPHDFTISAIPHFIIYPRANVVGTKPVADYTEEKIDFEPSSEKKLTFTLPGYEKAESYLTYLRFFDNSNQAVSGIAEFRWVIGGPGGKILTVKIDKTQSFFGKTTITGTVSVVGPPDGSNLQNTSLAIKFFQKDSQKNLLGIYNKDLTIGAEPTKISFHIQFSSKLLRSLTLITLSELTLKAPDVLLDTNEAEIPIILDYSAQSALIARVSQVLLATLIICIFLTVLLRKKRFSSHQQPTTFFFSFFFFLIVLFLFTLTFNTKNVSATSVTTNPSVSCSGGACNGGPGACGPTCGAPPQAEFTSQVDGTNGSIGGQVLVHGWTEHTFCNNHPTGYTHSVAAPPFLRKDWEYVYDVDSYEIYTATDAGNGTLSIYQTVSTINNCWGSCSSQDTHYHNIRITKPFFSCSGTNISQCDNPAGNFATLQECGLNCWESQASCRGACDPGPGQPDPIKSPEEQHLECQNLLCDYVDTDIAGLPASDQDLCQVASDCYPTATPIPIPPGPGGGVTPIPQFYTNCDLITDTHPHRAVCTRYNTAGPSTCLEAQVGSGTSANWGNWSAPPGSCGRVQESRSCQCSGTCNGINPGCWNGDTNTPVYATCGDSQFRAACLSQRPNNTPDITSVTQPTAALGSTKHNGGNNIQSLNVAVFWRFQEGQSACSKPWGFAQDPGGTSCINSLQQNKFVVKIYSPSSTLLETRDLIPPTGQNGNKNYSINTTDGKITTAGNYTVDVCANNGYGERCYSEANSGRLSFTKIKIPAATITGQLLEHFNYDLGGGNYCAPQGVSSQVQLQLVRQYTTTPGLPSSMDCQTSGLTQVDGISKITNYSCTMDYNNITIDIPTIDTYQGSIDYLNQTLSLQLKQPVVGYSEYYCPRTNNNNNYCTQGNLNNSERCTNNNSIEFVTSGPWPKNEFDQNDVSTVATSQTINVLFDIPNSGGNAGNYYKIKNAQFRSVLGIYSPFPANPLPFQVGDPDDTGGDWLITGQPGSPLTSPFDQPTATLGSGVTNGARQTGALLQISSKKWENNNYTSTLTFTPSLFIENSLSRKQVKIIQLMSEIESGKINIYENDPVGNPNLVINDSAINSNFILVVKNGTLTVTPDASGIFNSAGRSIMLISKNTLKFDPLVKEAKGVFFTNDVDLGTTTLPLKIKGNLIAGTVSGNRIDALNPLTRKRTDNQRPSFFVVFEAKTYMDLLPLLSTTAYQWSELVP